MRSRTDIFFQWKRENMEFKTLVEALEGWALEEGTMLGGEEIEYIVEGVLKHDVKCAHPVLSAFDILFFFNLPVETSYRNNNETKTLIFGLCNWLDSPEVGNALREELSAWLTTVSNQTNPLQALRVYIRKGTEKRGAA